MLIWDIKDYTTAFLPVHIVKGVYDMMSMKVLSEFFLKLSRDRLAAHHWYRSFTLTHTKHSLPKWIQRRWFWYSGYSFWKYRRDDILFSSVDSKESNELYSDNVRMQSVIISIHQKNSRSTVVKQKWNIIGKL